MSSVTIFGYPPQRTISISNLEKPTMKAAIKGAPLNPQRDFVKRKAHKTIRDENNTAVINCATKSGMPVINITKETKT
jgi:hypothetical protein